jgi:hypothetical protein
MTHVCFGRVIYTDDTVLTGPHPSELDKIVEDLATVFNITSSPVVEDFLGVKITQNHANSSYTLTQLHLIKSIIDNVGLQAKSKERAIPALASLILHSFDKSEAHHESWSYCAVIGKLNFLEKSTRPYIAYTVHQCTRFCQDPKAAHTKAVKLIVRHLKGTHDKGIFVALVRNHSIAIVMQILQVTSTQRMQRKIRLLDDRGLGMW